VSGFAVGCEREEMVLEDECEDERGISLKEEKECGGVTETLREWEWE
jgi:hypothetical protein